MSIYVVYFNPEKQEKSLILVKEGFSWAVVVFNWLWVIYKNIWWLMGIGVCINIVTGYLYTDFPKESIIAQIISCFFLGLFADDLYAYHLERQGYKLKDVIFAVSKEDAELKYYSRLDQTN